MATNKTSNAPTSNAPTSNAPTGASAKQERAGETQSRSNSLLVACRDARDKARVCAKGNSNPALDTVYSSVAEHLENARKLVADRCRALFDE